MDGVPATNYFENYLDRSFNDEKMQFLFPNMTDIDNDSTSDEVLIAPQSPAKSE